MSDPSSGVAESLNSDDGEVPEETESVLEELFQALQDKVCSISMLNFVY